MKTKGVTTKSGLKMEVSEMGGPFYRASESFTGDHAWEDVTLRFRTPHAVTGRAGEDKEGKD